MLDAALIVSIVRKGWGSTVLEASVNAGARGGTVLVGRGAGINEKERIFGMSIEPEKEIVLTVAYADRIDAILEEIVRSADLRSTGKGTSASYTIWFGNAHPIPEFGVRSRKLVA